MEPSSAAPEFETVEPSHVVGIGASAGGLEALERFFDKLPDDTGMAFVVVQHLSPDFKSLMNELLARWTRMPIHPVVDGMPLAANAIYLMPPKKEMIVSSGRLLLTDKEPVDELTLPIDQFFRSLAQDAGHRAVGVVLSGTGSDGSRGIRHIHEVGGLVLVQSEETAKFDGMPRSALETGVVDLTLAPEEMPVALLRHINHPAAAAVKAQSSEAGETGMGAVFRLLREHYGIDFSYYKPSTVARRTERRLQINQARDLNDYVERLAGDRDELDALYHDLLIGVTGFFRDEDAFRILETNVLPGLLANVPAGGEFRAWIAGCATGEEAYSLAILVDEQLAQLDRTLNVKIFATDVHRSSLDFAGLGVYGERSVEGVAPQRLKKYFTRNGDGYQVAPDLRKMVVFAQHNIIKDAPFTRLDLISCRNLLIYLQPVAQKKALCLFHFGLKTGGTLLLGPSETVGEIANEFDVVDPHWKVFRKRRDIRLPADLRLPLSMPQSRPAGMLHTPHRPADGHLLDVFAKLLEDSLPPSLLVDEDRQIVHSFGDAARFLRLRPGRPSLDVLEMLASDLKLGVAGALHRAARDRAAVSFSGLRAKTAAGKELINLTVTPLPAGRSRMSYTLISFEPAAPAQAAPAAPDIDFAEASRDRVDALESELRYTKENLQATIEELEASNEELQATNEEMLASNEELQSTNEELHSVNEELYTVNAEYQKKIAELTELTQDMDNLLVSTEVHTIFLDENLCIRKFTPKMAELFNLIPADVGRRIDSFMHNIDCVALPEKLNAVLSHGERFDADVKTKSGDDFLMRILPYRGNTQRSGVVMTLIDISGVKQAEARFRNAVEAAPSGMLMIDNRGQISLVNSETERMFGYQRDELLGQPIEMLVPERFRQQHVEQRQSYFQHPRLRAMAAGLDLWGRRKDGSEFPIDVRLSPVATPRGPSVLAAVVDVTDRKQLEASLRDQVEQRDRFLAMLSHELRNPLAAIVNAASLLARTARELPTAKEPCNVIRRQSAQMATLLDDLLDVSRVTQGKIKLRCEPCDLARLAQEALEAVGPLVTRHRHDVSIDAPDEPLWVDADPARLLQVIENLLTNAIKYTPDEGRIRVSVERAAAMESPSDAVTARGGESAVIRVSDSGRGIPGEMLSAIFDMFVQSNATLDRSEGGMGVGLTLVRSLVELHDGTIEVHSAGPDQGSEFVVRLPTTRKRPLPEAVSDDGEEPDRPLTVVLVEDNADTREMTQALLAFEGFHVETAADGREGVDLILKLRPDVALVDIGLPVLDGYQVARQVRDAMGGDKARLVAVTGYGREEDHEAVLDAGFDEHLVKPIRIKDLKNLLRGRHERLAAARKRRRSKAGGADASETTGAGG